jgi:hypothetical protein
VSGKKYGNAVVAASEKWAAGSAINMLSGRRNNLAWHQIRDLYILNTNRKLASASA